jgi:hypothetical protein
LHKEGLPATPTIPEYLIRELQPNEIAGIDGSLFSVNAVRSMQTALSKYGIKLHTKHDPLKKYGRIVRAHQLTKPIFTQRNMQVKAVPRSLYSYEKSLVEMRWMLC